MFITAQSDARLKRNVFSCFWKEQWQSGTHGKRQIVSEAWSSTWYWEGFFPLST